MGALKRLSVNTIEANRMKYRRMDALQLEEVVRLAVVAVLNAMNNHFPGRHIGGLNAEFAAELHSYIDGQLERLFGE